MYCRESLHSTFRIASCFCLGGYGELGEEGGERLLQAFSLLGGRFGGERDLANLAKNRLRSLAYI